MGRNCPDVFVAATALTRANDDVRTRQMFLTSLSAGESIDRDIVAISRPL